MSEVQRHNIAEIALAVFDANAKAVAEARSSLGGSFERAARAFAECNGKVLVTGSGTSGVIAARAAHLLSFCGTPAYYLTPADGLHGGLGVLQREDITVALSKGGSSEELNQFCKLAKKQCKILIVITAKAETALTRLADIVIDLKLSPDVDINGLVATGSSLAMATVMDALTNASRVLRNYSWDTQLSTHPSGIVGKHAEVHFRIKGEG